MNTPTMPTENQAKLIQELGLDAKTVTFKNQSAALPCQITIHTGDKRQTHLVSRDKTSGKLKLDVIFSFDPKFCLSNHSWRIQPDITTEMRNDPTRILRDCGETVLVRDTPFFAEQEDEPEDRLQVPNLNTPSLEICFEAEYLINLLKFKAKAGDSTAAQELAYLGIEAVNTLTEIAKTKPEILLPTSRKYNGWPVFRMKRQQLTDEEKTLFANLKIGEQSLIELDAATAKWKWDDAGKIAEELLFFIQRARTDQLFNLSQVGEIAKKLPDFDEDSAPDWWTLAKENLLFSYPEPQKIGELNQLVPMNTRSKKTGNMIANPKRKSDGKLKQAILRVLKSRFLSFAKNTSFGKTLACPT